MRRLTQLIFLLHFWDYMIYLFIQCISDKYLGEDGREQYPPLKDSSVDILDCTRREGCVQIQWGKTLQKHPRKVNWISYHVENLGRKQRERENIAENIS